jgi:colicin import membrane protein
VGQVTHVAEQLGGIRKREFRHMLVVSLVAHTAMASLLLLDLQSSAVMLPRVVSVELVSAPGSVAIPAPPPKAAPAESKPEPVPEPEPPPKPKPVVKKVVLPEQPRTPKPKPKAKKVVKQPPPPPADENYADVMAQLRADAGESRPEPVTRRTAAPAATGSAGGFGVQVSPEVAAWLKRAKIHVRRNWVLPPGFRTQHLEAHVLVDLDVGGNVVGVPKVVKRSGNPWFDEGVVRAIQSSSPLPAPPEPDEWAFVFVPGDSF